MTMDDTDRVDGSAVVTWTDGSRNVVTDFQFDTPRRIVEVTSNRTQKPLGGLGDGIEVNGERDWTGPSGSWTLDIDAVQMRGQDPIPQSGSYVLTNPDGKEFTLAFERLDDDTITVMAVGPGRELSFNVTRDGTVQQTRDA